VSEAAPERPRRDASVRLRVAYLVNQYPLLSHSFIRREIRALEAQGLEVLRLSIRPPAGALLNPADREELAATRLVLGAGASALARAALRSLARRPLRSLGALRAALAAGLRSDRGLLRHVVYFVEACLVREWTAAWGAHHLHAHFGTNSAMVALLCQRLGGPGYSFTVHGPEEFDDPEGLSLPAKIREARFVVAVSEFGRSQLYRSCGGDSRQREKVRVVRCGVDDALLDEKPAAFPASRRVVCVGRLCEEKAQWLLVEAAALLARTQAPFEIAIIGEGPLREELEAQIARHGLGERVRLLGALAEDEVKQQIRAARALVLPSFAEGLPVVIMEALALGRPVLSTWVAGIPELVEPGGTGWLVAPGSVTQLAEALAHVLEVGDEELAALGRRGAERVARRHDARHEAELLATSFRDAVVPERPRD
jgi:glycosyltransferase involved in cell wall biosynthesis